MARAADVSGIGPGQSRRGRVERGYNTNTIYYTWSPLGDPSVIDFQIPEGESPTGEPKTILLLTLPFCEGLIDTIVLHMHQDLVNMSRYYYCYYYYYY